MEAAVSDDESSKPVITGEDGSNRGTVSKVGNGHHGDGGDDDGDDDGDEEDYEGVRSAYSVSDLMDELDSGSDDQVGVANDAITKQTTISDMSGTTRAAGSEELKPRAVRSRALDKATDPGVDGILHLVQDAKNGNSGARLTLGRKVDTVQRPDTLDREVPVTESVKTSDAELSPEHHYEPISNGSQRGTLMQPRLQH